MDIKNAQLLTRPGFIFHRPRFFGKAFTSIIAQGIYGAKDIAEQAAKPYGQLAQKIESSSSLIDITIKR